MEFVNSATRGAVEIIDGNVPAINPMDPRSAHIFIYNNIFFSFALNAKESTLEDGSDVSYKSASNDILGARAYNKVNVQVRGGVGIVVALLLSSIVGAFSPCCHDCFFTFLFVNRV